MTEEEILAGIRSAVGDKLPKRISLGIGDDAALWQPSRSHRSAISSDMLVENVHFTRDAMSLEDAGWRAMAANLSDLAAMGARPVLATVALGVPQANAAQEIVEIYRGIAAAAKAYVITIAGGDLTRSDAITIAITVVGEVRPSSVKTRSGARAGDVIAVTGALGAARAGLDGEPSAQSAFKRPQPRIAEGRFLAASANVTAMMDCSDGLATDLRRLCAASGCGAALETIPVAPAASAAAKRCDEDQEEYALRGGEDFELIATIRPRAFTHIAKRYEQRFKKPLLRVGTIEKNGGISWRGAPLALSGWDHFR